MQIKKFQRNADDNLLDDCKLLNFRQIQMMEFWTNAEDSLADKFK